MTKKTISALFSTDSATKLFESQYPMLSVKTVGEPSYSLAPYSNDEYANFIVYAALASDPLVVNKYHVLMWWDVNELAVRLTLPDGHYKAFVKGFGEWLWLTHNTQLSGLEAERCMSLFKEWLDTAH